MEGYVDGYPISSFDIAMPKEGYWDKFLLSELHKKVILPMLVILMGEKDFSSGLLSRRSCAVVFCQFKIVILMSVFKFDFSNVGVE